MLALYLVPKYVKLFQFMPSVSGPILPSFYNIRKMELEVTSQCHPVNSRASYLQYSTLAITVHKSNREVKRESFHQWFTASSCPFQHFSGYMQLIPYMGNFIT